MTRVLAAERVEVALDAHAEVGEGPVWDATSGELVWVDIPRHLVHRLHPGSGRVESFDAGQPVSAVALRSAGGLVLALRDGFGLLDRQTGDLQLACAVEREQTANRMNDGKCDSTGRFWAGTMALDMSPGAGALYRLGTDLEVVQVLRPVSVSNGLAWSRDDRTMYFIDSTTNGVDAFDYTPGSGRIGNRRRLIAVAPDDGLPDGMTVDAEGFLWVALWDGWAVRRYAPDGTLDLVVQLPTAQITSCAFGGETLDELYVTSASGGLAEQARHDQPHAGAIFQVRTGVEGLPPQEFAG
ncbi:MAG: SMP-30/gluconolactonase/LRE family protein [Euzebyaceae bacterium]|nr:SMP-30/gluconolactonase/LRE family protein [Euzebyaceae bacterium]